MEKTIIDASNHYIFTVPDDKITPEQWEDIKTLIDLYFLGHQITVLVQGGVAVFNYKEQDDDPIREIHN